MTFAILGSTLLTPVESTVSIYRSRSVLVVETYSACSGDVFADVRSWNNDFGLADIVVFQEDNLQKITNILVPVHHSSNRIHEMNDLFSLDFHPI